MRRRLLILVVALLLSLQQGCATMALWSLTKPQPWALEESQSGVNWNLVWRGLGLPLTVPVDVVTFPLQLPFLILGISAIPSV